jgi:hypothetical protein
MSASNNSSSSLYSIEKLSGDNFTSWKFKLQLILMDRCLWEIVDGTEVAPSNTSGNVSGSGNDDVKPQTYIDWKKRDNQALAQIALTVSNSELVHIRNAKSSHDAWNKICSVYEAKGLAAKVYLRRRFFNIKYIDNGVGSMQTHINLVRDLADQLDAIGASVTDEDMAMTLLCSLPESYDYLIVALESRTGDDLTFDFVSTRLLAEEKRKEESHNVSVSSSINANVVSNYRHGNGNGNNVNSVNGNNIGNANNIHNNGNENIVLYSNAHGNGNINGNKGKHNKPIVKIKCNHCNKKGHTEDKCYIKHGYPIGHPKHTHTNTANIANVATVSVNNAVLHAFMVKNNVSKHSSNVMKMNNVSDWLIDSGASMHLCNNRSYFDNASYKSIQHQNVILGNNECIQAIGMGDVPVRICLNNVNNGSTSNIIDVVFKDVLYVPDIAANLLSVAKMTGNGVQVMFNGNECNIFNKVGECIGNAYKHANSNLYKISVTPIHAMIALNHTNTMNINGYIHSNVNGNDNGNGNAMYQH